MKGERLIHRCFLLVVLVVLCIRIPAFGESVKDLQKKQKKLQQEIEQTNKMLKQTKKDETATENKLQLIGQNIKNQKRLISTLDSEITALNREMNRLSGSRRFCSCSAATVFNS